VKRASFRLRVDRAAVVMRARAACAAALTLALVLACGEGTSPSSGRTGIRLLAGSGQTDTVDAVLAGALVVEVRDTLGTLASGQVVRFEATADTLPVVGVADLASEDFAGFAAVTTNSQGQAAVLVRLGPKAGTARVGISVPVFGLADSARFTVRPGAPCSVNGEPADTTVGLGASFQLRARVADRHANALAGSVTYQALDSAVSVSAAGVVTAHAVGIGRILAMAAGVPSDTSHVGVVPTATIAASTSGGVMIVNLDGSGAQTLTVPNAAYNGRFPTWLSATSLAVMDGQHYGELLRVSTSGAVQYLVPATDTVVLEVWPQASRDGSWIYFGGLVPAYSTSGISVWRVQPSGAGLERVSPPNADGEGDTFPSPSPDGTRVAIATTRFGSFTLAVIDVATKQLTALGVWGQSPRWAPAGDSIAYLGGGSQSEVWLVNANGGGNRRVSPAGRGYALGIDWSPDRHWIIARGPASLELIEVATGRVLPLLGLPSDLSQPVWKP
jgi:hypothetical protein